jgi:hypothetical protein
MGMKKEHIAIIILSILLLVSNIAWVAIYLGFQPFKMGKSWGWDSANGNNYWSGTERYKTTNAFMITGEEWRVSWGFSGGDKNTNFIISVYDAYTGEHHRTLQFFAEEEEGYLNVTGRFYLKIYFQAKLIDNWHVEVMEYR